MDIVRYIDLFCGIGGFRIATESVFREHGLDGVCVFSSDIDKYARETYRANFGHSPAGDICKINAADIPDHDLLFAGFPCQPFSIIGNGEGFDDTRGTLFFEIARIIENKQPFAFILENVKRLASHRNGYTLRRIKETLEFLDYNIHYSILNALDYGLPQKRERVFIVGFREPTNFNWPNKQPRRKDLTSVLENVVDKKHYASDYIVNKRKEKHISKYKPAIWHENKSGNVSSYPYSLTLRAGGSYNYLLVDGERRLTSREMLRLQGFPESFKVVCSDAQTRKQIGNAVPVDVVECILREMVPLIIFDQVAASRISETI